MTHPKPVKVERVRAPLRRSAPPKRGKRKVMPRCKWCSHRWKQHRVEFMPPPKGAPCCVCLACPGYQPARSAGQKRRTPAAALTRIADDLWTRVVHARPELCEVQQYRSHECVGGYQAMHGVPRTYKVTRHMPINGFKGCAGIHTYYSKHKEEWTTVLLDAWGPEVFRELWRDARSMRPVDMDATILSLRAELARARDRGAFRMTLYTLKRIEKGSA